MVDALINCWQIRRGNNLKRGLRDRDNANVERVMNSKECNCMKCSSLLPETTYRETRQLVGQAQTDRDGAGTFQRGRKHITTDSRLRNITCKGVKEKIVTSTLSSSASDFHRTPRKV